MCIRRPPQSLSAPLKVGELQSQLESLALQLQNAQVCVPHLARTQSRAHATPARALAGRAQALPSRASGSLISSLGNPFPRPPVRALSSRAKHIAASSMASTHSLDIVTTILDADTLPSPPPCARGSRPRRLAGSHKVPTHRPRGTCTRHRKCARQVAKLTQMLQARSSKGQGTDSAGSFAAGSLHPGAAAAAETADVGVQTEGVLLLPTVCV